MRIRQLIGRIKYGKPLIIVSGLPRSGTSMLMRMLEAGGLEVITDRIRGADEDNPTGYFELEQVKDLDKNKDKTWLRQFRGKAVKIISFLLSDLPKDLNYKVIFVLRDLSEVMASQNRMLAHRGEPVDTSRDEQMAANYTRHLRKVKYLLDRSPRIDVFYVNHQDVLREPKRQACRIRSFLRRRLDVEAMAAAVNADLYRNRGPAAAESTPPG